MKHALLAFCISIASVLLFLAFEAMAAEPAVISFTAPTSYTDGSPIAAGTAISYNVLQGAKGAALAKVATITSTTTTITTGLVPGQEYCFAVTAVVAGQESAPSNTACKLIPALVPGAVVITVR